MSLRVFSPTGHTAIIAACLPWLLCVIVAGCSPRRPVLYPNQHLQRVGMPAAQQAIAQCIQMAESYTTGSARRQATRDVAAGTTVGAATGAATGAVAGAFNGKAGRGAAIGAATGATAGFTHSLFSAFTRGNDNPTYRNFVDRCLRERGFEPIGWE